ncbi:MAG: DUF4238 domain-containing protein [Clostridia bacterium]
MKKNNPSGRHHFIPQFFIKRFSSNDDGKVFVFNKTFNKTGSIPQHPAEICHSKHLYSLRHGNVVYSILEDTFSAFESKWSGVFKLLDGNIFDSNILLKDKNAENLIRLFYACQFWRSPIRSDLAMRSAERLVSFYDEMDKGKYLLAGIERKDLKKIVKLKDSENNKKMIQYFLLPMMTYMLPFGEDAKFCIFDKTEIYDKDLVCSDVGVVADSIDFLFSGKKIIIFPFSSNRVITISKEGYEISVEDIENYQRLVFSSASQHLFCATQAGMQEFVSKFRV